MTIANVFTEFYRSNVNRSRFMDKLNLCITTLDQKVLSRWADAFKKEGWEVKISDCLRTASACRGELDLVEICAPLCKSPDDLETFINRRKPVATLAFAAPQNISDSLIVKFLGAGADDFVLNTMDERVLVAKLKAYTRRLAPTMAATMCKVTSDSGDVKIDPARRWVRIETKPGKFTELIRLTQKELEILHLLVDNETSVVSRENMLEKLWGSNATEVYSNCINKHIETLRRKLGPHGKRIKTIYGSGYMFT